MQSAKNITELIDTLVTYRGHVKLPDINFFLDLFNKEKVGKLVTVVVHTQRLW